MTCITIGCDDSPSPYRRRPPTVKPVKEQLTNFAVQLSSCLAMVKYKMKKKSQNGLICKGKNSKTYVAI